jgi:uncharacterized damage-inducible protein DinB
MQALNIYLANRVREVLLHGTWIANTNWKQQVENLSYTEANYKIANTNSIALLTFHICYYLKGLNNVFAGGNLEIRDKYSFSMPPIQAEHDWKNLVTELLYHAELFAKNIENLSESTLDQAFVDEKYGTYLRNIEGVIEHSYYHLGQVSLIKKIVSAKIIKPDEL